MKLTEVGQRLADGNLKDFEKKYNVQLPADYKEFMLSNNGGMPENRCWIFF